MSFFGSLWHGVTHVWKDVLNVGSLGLTGYLGRTARAKERRASDAYNKRSNQIDELKSYIYSYDNKLKDSNTKVPENVRALYDKLKTGSESKEPNMYRLNDMSGISNAHAMESRLASRFNRENIPQNARSSGQEIADSITFDNQRNRINRGVELGAEKHAYDTYSNLFSQYIGNLNSESRMKENRVLSTEKSMHDQYFKLSKTLEDAQAKQKASSDSLGGKINHLMGDLF